MNKIKSYYAFIREHLWIHPVEELNSANRIVLQQIRVFALALKGLKEDKVGQKASALTYYSLWALIPVLAFFFAIARGFGFNDVLDTILKKTFETNPEIGEQIQTFINGYLDTISDGFFVGIGVLVLFWSVMSVLGQIENVFNDIWQNPKSRSILRKFTDYFAFIIFIPIFIVTASGANLFLSSHLTNFLESFGMEIVVGPITKVMAQLMPVILFSIMFTLLYLIMPNTKVKFLSALIPGIIVGFLLQLLQIGYINSQAAFSRFNSIYSGLVAIPLMLLVFQTSWTVILFGAEVSFALQNIKNFMYVDQVREISEKYTGSLSLFITYIIVKRFENGEKPIGIEQISNEYNIPNQLTSKVIYRLVKAGILIETLGKKENVNFFQPALDINQITVSSVQYKLQSIGNSNFLPIQSEAFQRLNGLLGCQQNLLNNHESNILIKDIDTNLLSSIDNEAME